MSVNDDRRLRGLLERLVDEVPGIHYAVLASTDGLPKSCGGIDDPAAADRCGALAATMFSMGRGGVDGEVRQVVVEADHTTVFIVAAGEGSILSVTAGHDTDPVLVGHAMRKMVKGVREHLATPMRQAAAPGDR